MRYKILELPRRALQAGASGGSRGLPTRRGLSNSGPVMNSYAAAAIFSGRVSVKARAAGRAITSRYCDVTEAVAAHHPLRGRVGRRPYDLLRLWRRGPAY